MANSNLLKEAIADAKAVRETAIANAKIALEEAFTPRLQSILSQKLQQEIEGEDEEKEEVEEGTYNADGEEEITAEGEEEVNEDMPVLTIKNGAHHADTWLPVEGEDKVGPTSNIKETREKIEAYLEKWMKKHQ